MKDYIEIKDTEINVINTNKSNKNGETPLIVAIKNREYEQARFLLKNFANIVNGRDNDFRTALHWAVLKGEEEAVSLLMEYFADINCRDKDEKTPLMLMQERRHNKNIERLLKISISNPDADKHKFREKIQETIIDGIDVISTNCDELKQCLFEFDGLPYKENVEALIKRLVQPQELLFSEELFAFEKLPPSKKLSFLKEEATLEKSLFSQKLPSFEQLSSPEKLLFIEKLIYPEELSSLEKFSLFERKSRIERKLFTSEVSYEIYSLPSSFLPENLKSYNNSYILCEENKTFYHINLDKYKDGYKKIKITDYKKLSSNFEKTKKITIFNQKFQESILPYIDYTPEKICSQKFVEEVLFFIETESQSHESPSHKKQSKSLKSAGLSLIKKEKKDGGESKKEESQKEIECLEQHSLIFQRLNKLIVNITEFQEFIGQKRKKDFNRVIQLLEEVKQIYIEYRAQACDCSGRVRVEHCIGRLRVRGFFGHRYLSAGAAFLFKQRKENVYGQRRVIEIESIFYKEKPTNPSIEDAVRKSTGQESPPTELLIFEGVVSFPVLASKGVEGDNLADVIAKNPEWFKVLDPFNFSSQIVRTFLTCPTDDKAQNFICPVVRDENGKVTSMKVVCIDNDESFGKYLQRYDITSGKKNELRSESYIDLKSILLCFPQMNDLIDARFRQVYLDQFPILEEINFLKELYIQNQKYSLMNLTPEEFEKIQIPIKFHAGTTWLRYEMRCAIREFLIRNPKATHHELFQTIYPIAAAYYSYIRANFSSLAEAEDYFFSTPNIEEIFQNNAEIYKKIIGSPKYNTLGEYSEKTEAILDACHILFNSLDYAELPEHLRSCILERISTEFPFIETLVIRNCPVLDDGRLKILGQNLKKLQSLTLINCVNVDGAGLSNILDSLPNIELILENVTKISTANLLDLIQCCPRLFFVLSGNIYKVQSDSDELLKIAMQNKDYENIATALLMSGAHLFQWRESESPLHYAAKEAQNVVASKLMRYGMDVNAIDKNGDSVLDVVCEALRTEKESDRIRKYPSILFSALCHGALQCREKNREFILEMVQPLLKINNVTDKNREKIFVFVRYYNLLTPKWIPIFISSDSKKLDLGSSKAIPYEPKIMPDEMSAIHKEIPQLEELIITDCKGLDVPLLNELCTWNLKSIEMNFQQAVQCKITSLDSVNEAHNLNSDGTKIKITAFSTVHFLGRKLNQENFTKLSYFIGCSSDLKTLELVNCGLGTVELKCLISDFSKNKSLESVVIKNCQIDDDNLLAELIQILSDYPNLCELVLEKVGIGEKSAERIGEMLGKHPNIKILSLHKNVLGDVGAQLIAEGITTRGKEKYPSLESLNLNQTEMGAKGAIALSAALISCRKLGGLKVFDVGHNSEIKDDGACSFIELLELTKIQDSKVYEIGANKHLVKKLEELQEKIKKSAKTKYLESINLPSHQCSQERPQNLVPREIQERKELEEKNKILLQQNEELRREIERLRRQYENGNDKNIKEESAISHQSEIYHSPRNGASISTPRNSTSTPKSGSWLSSAASSRELRGSKLRSETITAPVSQSFFQVAQQQVKIETGRQVQQQQPQEEEKNAFRIRKSNSSSSSSGNL